jgi:predicted ATPase
MIPSSLSFLARGHSQLGQFEEALRCVGEAISAVDTTKERWWEADIHRVAGEIWLASCFVLKHATAEACFERSLAIARQQLAKSWELRASMSLARLWRDQGKVRQARELLAPVYGWFTEGFDTRDLKDAMALLQESGA